jgi:streptogramin lyase
VSRSGFSHFRVFLLAMAAFSPFSAGQTIFDGPPPAAGSGKQAPDQSAVPRNSQATTVEPNSAPALKLPLAAKFIMCLCEDQQSNIWVGTEDEGIWRLNPRTGESKRFTTADGMGDNSGYAIACDRKGAFGLAI